ncbi:MAG: HAMP domain-containing histidine kinase [Planctomycetes bacterium]|nr:HAMP domain-containing histidine kinase [Planctomycetota bacterium]
MSGKAVGRAAVALPWLCPNTDDLIRLAEAPAGLARPCEAAPALLAFLLRFVAPASAPHPGLFCPASLAVASLPETAAAYLAASRDGWVPACEVAKRCRALTGGAVKFARRLAEHTRRVCPERAAAVAALAPLGWLAVAAVDYGIAAEPLHDPHLPADASVQAAVWGLDQNAIARRLANRWRLPEWIASALGNLNLPLTAAKPLVPDADLFAVAQLAVHEAERRTRPLGLAAGADRPALLAALKLDPAAVDALWSVPSADAEPQSAPALAPNPHAVPLVVNLLKMAGESRRRNGAALVLRLEERVDDLHRAVAGVGTESDDRARAAKLAALAEVAAGAGHEINNPLSVISGQAQRLFRTEPDVQRGESLQTIIRQTQRIAGIVRDLMQFARPPQPQPHRTAATELLTAVRDELSAFAGEKGVRIELGAAPAAAHVRCDFAQIRHALAAVVRNGIEAAGAGGHVRIGCADGADELVEFVVEDSGPGLCAAALEHCFDPFYCGRSAGRGRGLGLPTAWQFARQNGGDLRHEPTAGGPTRFVLSVPRSVTLEFLDRQSA